jgi:hypothetical protein
MTNVFSSTRFPGRMHARAIAALVPFFADNSTGDITSARLLAEALLDSYDVVDAQELQLAAQIIALGWAAMGCVSAAVAAKNLSVDEVLRLQGNAIALDRFSQKATRTLAACRKERARNPNAPKQEHAKWDEGVSQLISQALEKLTDANAKVAAYVALPTQPPEPTLKPVGFAKPTTRSLPKI